MAALHAAAAKGAGSRRVPARRRVSIADIEVAEGASWAGHAPCAQRPRLFITTLQKMRKNRGIGRTTLDQHQRGHLLSWNGTATLPGGAEDGAERGALGPRRKGGAVSGLTLDPDTTVSREHSLTEWLPPSWRTDRRPTGRCRLGCDRVELSEWPRPSGSHGTCLAPAITPAVSWL